MLDEIEMDLQLESAAAVNRKMRKRDAFSHIRDRREKLAFLLLSAPSRYEGPTTKENQTRTWMSSPLFLKSQLRKLCINLARVFTSPSHHSRLKTSDSNSSDKVAMTTFP